MGLKFSFLVDEPGFELNSLKQFLKLVIIFEFDPKLILKSTYWLAEGILNFIYFRLCPSREYDLP